MIHRDGVLENSEVVVLVILGVTVFLVVLVEFFHSFHVMNEIVSYSNNHCILLLVS